jgi:hypothetical protein
MQPPPTTPRLALVAEVQRAITGLLQTHEPVFIDFGMTLFLAFATILIAWQGIRMMFQQDSLGDHMFDFARQLMHISFGFALIRYYESPIPGVGTSFTNLITDQAHYFATVLETSSLELVNRHLDVLWSRFIQPDPWAILPILFYWALFGLVLFAKILSLAVIAFGLIAGAVCALLGPIFVPFFILPKLDWLFWSWFKSFVQHNFVQVVALAFLMIFERFLFAFVSTLPNGITERQYPIYLVQALVIVGTFALGILLVPSLTNSIFSGHGGQTILPERFRIG